MRETERPDIALTLRTLFALAFLAVITVFGLPLAKKALRRFVPLRRSFRSNGGSWS